MSATTAPNKYKKGDLVMQQVGWYPADRFAGPFRYLSRVKGIGANQQVILWDDELGPCPKGANITTPDVLSARLGTLSPWNGKQTSGFAERNPRLGLKRNRAPVSAAMLAPVKEAAHAVLKERQLASKMEGHYPGHEERALEMALRRATHDGVGADARAAARKILSKAPTVHLAPGVKLQRAEARAARRASGRPMYPAVRRNPSDRSKLSAAEIKAIVLANVAGGERLLTDVARDPTLRGVHFARIVAVVDSLNKAARVSFDGVHVAPVARGRRNPGIGDYFRAGKRAAAETVAEGAKAITTAAAEARRRAEAEAVKRQADEPTLEQAIRVIAKAHGVKVNPRKRRNPDFSGALTIAHEASGDVVIRHVAHNPRKRRNPGVQDWFLNSWDTKEDRSTKNGFFTGTLEQAKRKAQEWADDDADPSYGGHPHVATVYDVLNDHKPVAKVRSSQNRIKEAERASKSSNARALRDWDTVAKLEGWGKKRRGALNANPRRRAIDKASPKRRRNPAREIETVKQLRRLPSPITITDRGDENLYFTDGTGTPFYAKYIIDDNDYGHPARDLTGHDLSRLRALAKTNPGRLANPAKPSGGVTYKGLTFKKGDMVNSNFASGKLIGWRPEEDGSTFGKAFGPEVLVWTIDSPMPKNTKMLKGGDYGVGVIRMDDVVNKHENDEYARKIDERRVRANPSAARAVPSVNRAIIEKIRMMTDENDHTGALVVLARDVLKSPTFTKKMLAIQAEQDRDGYLSEELNTRIRPLSKLMFAQAKRRLDKGTYYTLHSCF